MEKVPRDVRVKEIYGQLSDHDLASIARLNKKSKILVQDELSKRKTRHMLANELLELINELDLAWDMETILNSLGDERYIRVFQDLLRKHKNAKDTDFEAENEFTQIVSIQDLKDIIKFVQHVKNE